MSKNSSSNNATNRNIEIPQKTWGFEYIYSSFLSRVDSWSTSSLRKYIIISLSVSALLLMAGSLLPWGQYFQAAVSFPAAILIFASLLSIAHVKESPERLTIRERFTPAKRRKIGYVAIAILLFSIIWLSSYLPYAIGGVLLLIGVLALYNTIRRTPEELIIAQTGMKDPRDIVKNDDNADILNEPVDIYYDKDDDPWKDESI